VFTEPLPSNRNLLWFGYPGFQQTRHNILNNISYLSMENDAALKFDTFLFERKKNKYEKYTLEVLLQINYI
jgi:hypothetical protein